MGVTWTEEQQKVISLRESEYSGQCCSWLRKKRLCLYRGILSKIMGYRKTSGH